MEFICERMKRNTKGVDKIIKCMEWDRLFGRMEGNIVGNILRIRNKVMALLNGRMGKNI